MGNFDVDEMIAHLRHIEAVVLPETALAIMEEAVEHGAKTMARILDAPESFTAAGIARVETGQGEFAGRHVDGTMIEGIGKSVVVVGDTVIGTFGWANPDDYFLAQDWGTQDGHVPAAHSLMNSFIQTDELFRELVRATVEAKG